MQSQRLLILVLMTLLSACTSVKQDSHGPSLPRSESRQAMPPQFALINEGDVATFVVTDRQPFYTTTTNNLVASQSSLVVELIPTPRWEQAVTRISGPRRVGSLQLSLLHGPDSIALDSCATLQEAVAAGDVIIHETGEVGRLSIENRSDREIFIQAGDVVKGGKQDRVLRLDLLLPPRSGRVSIASFCVEAGRWSPRSGESSATFSMTTSNNLAASGFFTTTINNVVAQQDGQREMWSRVASYQVLLSSKLATPVRSEASPSSLQLSLGNEALQDKVAAARKTLETWPGPDAIGFAYAIDGVLVLADVYASSKLFGKLWPRLLEMSLIEGLATGKQTEQAGAVTAKQLRDFMASAEAGTARRSQLNERMTRITQMANDVVLFASIDEKRAGAWIHRNYVRR